MFHDMSMYVLIGELWMQQGILRDLSKVSNPSIQEPSAKEIEQVDI